MGRFARAARARRRTHARHIADDRSGLDRSVARVRVRIDETALSFRNEDVAVGAEDVGSDVAAPRAAPMRGEERGRSGALRAGAGIEDESAVAADELHDPAHGRGAVEVGGAAAEDLDTVERRALHASQ